MTSILQNLLIISPFFFPLYLIRFSVAGIPLTALEVYCYLLFLIWGVLFLQKKVTFKKGWNWIYFFTLLILIGATIGVVITPEIMPAPLGETVRSRRVALGIWKGWVMAPMMWFWVATQSLSKKNTAQKIIQSYIHSAGLVSLAAFLSGFWGVGWTDDLRLSGFYESANYLALYIGPAILFGSLEIVKIYKEKQKNWSSFWMGTSTIISILALGFSKSYAGILAIFGAIFLYLVVMGIRSKTYRPILIKGIIGLMILFFGLIAWQWNSPKFQQFIDFENRSSTTVRLELYEASWGLLKMKPVFGLGPGLFEAHYHNNAHEILGHLPMEWGLPHPHNLWLGFWFNAGILGLIGFLGLMVLTHLKWTDYLIGLWGILIHGLFDMPFWKNDLAMVFWLIALAIVLSRES